MTERFRLILQVCENKQEIDVEDPTVIDDKLIQITWNMIGVFVEQTLEDLGLEANEARLREMIIECCYRLILREMTTLRNLPLEGKVAKARPKSRRARRKERQEGEE